MHKGMHEGMMGGEAMGGEMMGGKTYMALWKYLSPEQQREIAMRALDLKIAKISWKMGCMEQKLDIMQQKLDLFLTAREMLTSGGDQGFAGQMGPGMMGESYGGYGRQMGSGGYGGSY